MLAYNNLREIVQALPIFASVVFLICAIVPFKLKRYSGVLMAIFALVVSFGYSVIANDYLDWIICITWMIIFLTISLSIRYNYKIFKEIEEAKSKYEEFVMREICITKMLNEGKYEPYQRPASES